MATPRRCRRTAGGSGTAPALPPAAVAPLGRASEIARSRTLGGFQQPPNMVHVGVRGRNHMLRLFSSSAALLLLLSVAASARAQVEAQVEDLNSQAMEAYQALDMDTARAKLEQAIGIAQQNGLMGPVV